MSVFHECYMLMATGSFFFSLYLFFSESLQASFLSVTKVLVLSYRAESSAALGNLLILFSRVALLKLCSVEVRTSVCPMHECAVLAWLMYHLLCFLLKSAIRSMSTGIANCTESSGISSYLILGLIST